MIPELPFFVYEIDLQDNLYCVARRIVFSTGGYRRGAASVEMRDSTVTRWVPWPVPVYDTIREPYPVAVREPADTVWKYMSVDTAAIIADYLLERDYRLDFSADSTGTFLVDATVGENRLLRASAVVKPVFREITVTKLHTEVRAAALGNGTRPRNRSIQPVGGRLRTLYERSMER